ncbi:CD48 antigen [Bos javanicus]|uniref:CD48 antigen n=1 Tax=Bos javanicus TaxID=9906 RepID=UPI002AA6DF71|nr:CD48 antigen [Bos javanicus]
MCSRRREWSLTLEILLLPHLFLAISIQGHSKYAIPGDNVTLHISNLPKNHKSLTWFYTTDQKIVEWEFDEPMYFNTKFKDRATLHPQSGALLIRNIQKEDSSTYLLRVLKDNGDEEEWKISLMVLDPVQKPVITVKKLWEMNNCKLMLSCVIQNQSVDYTWYWESGSFPKQLQGSVLQVVHTPQNYSKSYTCQVSNPVSSQNSTINFTSPCEQASSSEVARTATWLVIIVTTLLNLLWI